LEVFEMRNLITVLFLAITLIAHAAPSEKPRLTQEWVNKDKTTWETKVFTFSKEWTLQAVLLNGVMYLRQSTACPKGSVAPRNEIIAQAKSALTRALVECDGSTGFALVGWFMSEEFLSSLPEEVRTW
jgi:hypothetical protein